MAVHVAESVTVDSVVYGGRRYVFAQPIEVSPSRPEGHWAFEYEPLELWAVEPTREEAWDGFCECVAYVWEEFANLPDEGQLKSTLAFREKVRRLIRGVEPA